MKLALILYALLGLSVCAKLPDTKSGNRVIDTTEYQQELLNRTNRIVADKLAILTSYLGYYKALVSEKIPQTQMLINHTIEQIKQLQPTKDKEAACLSQKKHIRNRLRLFATASREDGSEQSLSAISKKIEASIENFKKQNTLTASDSDKIPRNPADERDFLYRKLYDLKAQMMRELINITLEYFYQRKAEMQLISHIMNGTMSQMNAVCGTTKLLVLRINEMEEIPERLQRLILEGPAVLLAQDNKTAGPVGGEDKESIDYKLRELSEKLVNLDFEPPCNPPNVTNTSWGSNETQVMLKKQFITQWHDGCRLSSSKTKDYYHQMAYLEQFRAPKGSPDEINQLINELDYENSVPVSSEQKRYKLEFVVCLFRTTSFILSDIPPAIRKAFNGSCGLAKN